MWFSPNLLTPKATERSDKTGHRKLLHCCSVEPQAKDSTDSELAESTLDIRKERVKLELSPSKGHRRPGDWGTACPSHWAQMGQTRFFVGTCPLLSQNHVPAPQAQHTQLLATPLATSHEFAGNMGTHSRPHLGNTCAQVGPHSRSQSHCWALEKAL